MGHYTIQQIELSLSLTHTHTQTHRDVNDKVCLTHWLNVLQNISQKGLPYPVTLNPSVVPNHTLLKWTTGHPVPNVAATKASLELDCIQGKRGIWFCGAYQGEEVC
ncbi:hypothetical protein POM88_037818 [Heracleum sosnowskyi]|uniref:Uncharacterized protein n=1 Tax=Heracleum sosnowskyi TaxID=360622 RepID=A0AAD8HRU8_9APIA|nr:hypothetical protein POM88_037818 [Heracleum sosnowskyi]